MGKPVVLHLGEGIKFNHDFYKNEFATQFDVVSNTATNRDEFIQALKDRKYGNFSAIFRPHFQTGGEMGQWDDELISYLPQSVKIFASAGAGFNWADVDALGRRKIWYAKGAGASDDAVSDTALYMILSVFRNFTRAQIAARTAEPERFTAAHRLLGGISHNPKGHVLGIVGLGNVSCLLARKAQAIGMTVYYYDVFRHSEEAEKSLNVTWKATLKELLAESDFVSLHVLLNASTRHLINAESISWIKEGARLINTARGEVVEEQPLIDALQSGKLSAAGLDVHYSEPQVSKQLAAMENVTLTVHCGGGAIETRLNFELNAMKNIIAVVAQGLTPLTPVNAKTYNAS